jgi:hypothetical protein
METPRLKSADIPQAEDLTEVRELVSALLEVGTSTESLAAHTGFSDRHVCYRLHAAKVLGLIDDQRSLTDRGDRLLATPPGSPDERSALSDAVASCPVVRLVAPDLLTAPALDLSQVSAALTQAAGLSPSTAERRARILEAWRQQLAEPPPE